VEGVLSDARTIEDAEEQIERLNARVVELLTERDELRKALEPFAQTGWLTGDTEHTARTVVAHMHPEREREIILSSEDFRRAKAALTDERGNS
jgi:hypothetical protein